MVFSKCDSPNPHWPLVILVMLGVKAHASGQIAQIHPSMPTGQSSPNPVLSNCERGERECEFEREYSEPAKAQLASASRAGVLHASRGLSRLDMLVSLAYERTHLMQHEARRHAILAAVPVVRRVLLVRVVVP